MSDHHSLYERFSEPWSAISATPLDVRTDMEQAPWVDVQPKNILHGRIERIGLLRHGTSHGRASIAILIRLDDGRAVIGETTWRLFDTAAKALAASPVAAEEGN